MCFEFFGQNYVFSKKMLRIISCFTSKQIGEIIKDKKCIKNFELLQNEVANSIFFLFIITFAEFSLNCLPSLIV